MGGRNGAVRLEHARADRDDLLGCLADHAVERTAAMDGLVEEDKCGLPRKKGQLKTRARRATNARIATSPPCSPCRGKRRGPPAHAATAEAVSSP